MHQHTIASGLQSKNQGHKTITINYKFSINEDYIHTSKFKGQSLLHHLIL